jgi:hypothetical protein
MKQEVLQHMRYIAAAVTALMGVLLLIHTGQPATEVAVGLISAGVGLAV